MKKALVIGSNCFSASNFVDYTLAQGYEVFGTSRSAEAAPHYLPYKINNRKGFTFLKADLNTELDKIISLCEEHKPGIIVNFAAQGMVAESWQYPMDYYRTNALGHIALHEKVRHFDFLEKYVHISTPEVYGSTSGVIKEDAPYNPSTPYAASKAACDMSLRTFYQNYNFPVCSTRAANVYGRCQALYRIIPKTILSILKKTRLPLHGGGHSVRAFIHMTDVSAATLAIAEKGKDGSIYHISTDRFISIRDLVKMICEILNISFEDAVDITDDRPGKDAAYTLDSTKVRTELGWEAKISLEQGIDECIKWVKDNFDVLKTEPDFYQHKK